MAKASVLIADDEEGILESLKLILQPDYEVTLARDGQDALAKLEKQLFDLVLLDVKMPKTDGIEVLRWIRSHRGNLPVLMLTAYQSVEVAKEAVRLGATDYLPKPFDRNHVVVTVRETLKAHRAK